MRNVRKKFSQEIQDRRQNVHVEKHTSDESALGERASFHPALANSCFPIRLSHMLSIHQEREF